MLNVQQKCSFKENSIPPCRPVPLARVQVLSHLSGIPAKSSEVPPRQASSLAHFSPR